MSRIGVWRAATALLVLVSAVIHGWLYADWAHSVFPLGEAFVFQAAVGVVLVVLLLVWRHWLPLAGAVVFGFGSVAAFFLTAATGVLGVEPQFEHLDWTEITSKTAELLAGATALLALRAERTRPAPAE